MKRCIRDESSMRAVYAVAPQRVAEFVVAIDLNNIGKLRRMMASDEIAACPATQEFDLKILRDCAYQRLDDLMQRSVAANYGNASISGSQGLGGKYRRMPCVLRKVQL